MKKITCIIFAALVEIILIGLLAGCTQTQLAPLPMNVRDFSLTRVWYRFLDTSGMQERSGNLTSFILMTDKNGAARTLHLEFTGISSGGRLSAYFADVTNQGDFHYQEYDLKNSVAQTRSPLAVFSEIDKLGLSSISHGPEGLFILMDFSSSNVSFTDDRYDIYELRDGQLLPLKEVTFTANNVMQGKITVTQSSSSSSGVAFAAPTELNPTRTVKPVPAEARTMQIWFISQDIDKAQSVQYSDN